MSRRFQHLLLFPCTAVMAGFLACGGGGSSPAPPATADFSIQVMPGSLQIPAGGSGFMTVTLARLNGFSSAVTISGVGLPAGVVASGMVAAGTTTLQLPILVAAGLTPSSYAGLSLRAQSGTLSHAASFSLTVTQALAPGHLRDDLVQAGGGRQTGGSFVNQAVVQEGLPAQTVKDANDSTQVRQGFYPNGAPADY